MQTPNLTARQARFVDEFLIDGNGAAAAVRAGYSAKTARFIASENLTKPYIAMGGQLRVFGVITPVAGQFCGQVRGPTQVCS
ncbi:MAG: terminase small subunit [Rhodoferax sp.]|nr:terminase small subunit [Rhodoferax sp.]